MDNSDCPAKPFTVPEFYENVNDQESLLASIALFGGLTKREELSARFVVAILTSHHYPASCSDDLSKKAVEQADSLLREWVTPEDDDIPY